MKRAFIAFVARPGDEERCNCSNEKWWCSAQERDCVGTEAETFDNRGIEIVEAVCCVVANEHKNLFRITVSHKQGQPLNEEKSLTNTQVR